MRSGAFGVMLVLVLGTDSARADRDLEPLEEFELSALVLDEVLCAEDCVAVFLGPGGGRHIIRVGGRIGKHMGKIVAIDDRGVSIEEAYRGSDGGYVERRSFFSLKGESMPPTKAIEMTE